jgi:hypothetical protein
MRNTLLLAAAMLLPLTASAAATNTGYSEEQAQAFFSSVQGCEDVVVGVSIVEPESIKPKAPLQPTQAFIFGAFNNICDIGSSFSFADVITLDEESFEQKGLNTAQANFVANIGGFDITVALDWNGVGKTDKNKNRVRFENDGIKVHDSDVIASRAADISGTFTVNGIDYAVGTETGGLSSIKAHTVQIEK